ncbi:unnamed protein product, partial [Meganyctiphanes norvegica]
LAPVPDYKATEIVYNNTSTNTPVVAFAPIAKVLIGNAPPHVNMFHALVCALFLNVSALGPGNAPIGNHAPGYHWNLYAPGNGFATEGWKATSSYDLKRLKSGEIYSLSMYSGYSVHEAHACMFQWEPWRNQLKMWMDICVMNLNDYWIRTGRRCDLRIWIAV